jgi:hypothetical protein
MAPLFCLTGAKVNFIYYTPNVSMEKYSKKIYFKEEMKKNTLHLKKNGKTICSLKISCTFAAVIKNGM